MKNIKNIFTIAAGMFLATAVNAQTSENKETKEVKIVKKTTETTAPADSKENEIKNFRFGLAIMPSVNWYDTESKILQRNGAALKFGGGLIMEFRLAKVASIQTGVNILTAGGKLIYRNGGLYNPGATTINYYYDNKVGDIVEYNSVTASTINSHTRYQLNARKYKTTYISVPVLLKLKTREIGSMVYFGQFGLNSFFRWKARANDEVQVLDASNSGTNEKKSNLMISKDASIYNAALNFGLGAEYNLAGTTSLVIGANYNLGFTNVLRKDSKYLEKRFNHDDYNMNSTTNNTYYTVGPLEQIVKENSIVLTVGVLF
jgi:hypothetical protein